MKRALHVFYIAWRLYSNKMEIYLILNIFSMSEEFILFDNLSCNSLDELSSFFTVGWNIYSWVMYSLTYFGYLTLICQKWPFGINLLKNILWCCSIMHTQELDCLLLCLVSILVFQKVSGAGKFLRIITQWRSL